MPPVRTFTAIAAVLSASAAFAQSDNFDDNAVGSQWAVLTDNPAGLSIAEVNGTAGITSTALGTSTQDALYLSNGSNGFRLSTADPFNIQIDYNFTDPGTFLSSFGDYLGVVFGVGEDLDGQNSAAIGYGIANGGLINVSTGVVAVRVDDAQSTDAALINPIGTFIIDYDPALDVLRFTSGLIDVDEPGLVQGIWDADALYVSFGARGSGFGTDPSTAFFDNFVINSGTVVGVPEPATLGLLTLSGLAVRRRPRGRVATA